VLPLEGSAAIISVETCTGREFSVITVRVDCAGQSFQDDIFSNVTSSMISSHEDVFDMSNDDTCLYGGGVCDVEHGMPRQCLHFGGSSDIFSDAVSEGLIKDAFVVITEFNNVSGDVIDGERHLVDSIPVGLAWNKNKAGANLFSTHSKQMVLYICAFQTACKGDIIRNKKCVKRANGTDAYSKGTDAYSKGTDKYSKGTDKYSKGTDKYSKGTDKYSEGTDKLSMGIGKVAMGIGKVAMGIGKVAMGTAKLPSSSEIPNADFELTCKKCNMTRKVDSVNGKVKIFKSGSKYVLAKKANGSYHYHCPSCKSNVTAKSIKKL
jgi:hypothetical protein